MSGGTAYRRTRNSLRNSFVAVGLQIVALLIGFWSRRVFLNCLGTEVLGLNTTATSLLQFLNLAEMGIGSAIAVTLYKPIFDDDKQSIKEIVALQGWMYRIIALIVMGGSAVMMCFFPLIFSKTPLPLWYAYASFGVLLYSSLLGYFFNYKQILLDAHQQNYKIQLTVKLTSIFKLLAQALAVKFLDNGYVWWLILEVVFATFTTVLLSFTVNKSYPYIKEKIESPAELRHKYPVVVTKVKQLFVHKIAGFASNQLTPVIIYAFASLTLVAKYGNYLILTSNLNYVLAACFLGITSSIGNMLSEHNDELTMKVFRELFSIRQFVNFVSCICLWFLVDPFIRLWIGDEYILDRSTLLLVIIVFYIYNSRTVVDTFLNAYGLFQDIWSPVAETVLGVVSSILLGRIYGLNGILTGMIISQFLIAKVWKPVFLFTQGIKKPLSIYLRINVKHFINGALSFAVVYLFTRFSNFECSSFGIFTVYALIVFAICAVMMFGLEYITEQGMRNFIKRILAVIKS